MIPFASAVDNDADGVEPPADCDDSDSTVYPGAPEVVDGLDNDCDGLVDEGLDPDADGDGFPASTDCDDQDPMVHPGAPEMPDGLDNDCNGLVDDLPDADEDGVSDWMDNCPATPNPSQADFDEDGRGDACDDSDQDGLLDEDELLIGTEPFVRDTDRDGVWDGDEVWALLTDPLDADSDGDLHKDGTEVDAGSDPLDPMSVPLAGGAVVAAPNPLGVSSLAVTDELDPLR